MDPRDTTLTWDVYVRDVQTSYTRRVSLSTAGAQGNELSSLGEGRVVWSGKASAFLAKREAALVDLVDAGGFHA